MSDIYQITLTTQTSETFRGKMTRSQPELVNGFIRVAKKDGAWAYLAPDDVFRMEYVPKSL